MDVVGCNIVTASYVLIFPDTDECATGTHMCDNQATCNNTDGSYTCTCNEGYDGTGNNCSGIHPSVKD